MTWLRQERTRPGPAMVDVEKVEVLVCALGKGERTDVEVGEGG